MSRETTSTIVTVSTLMALSSVTSLLLLVWKGWILHITHSQAVLSDFIESVMHVFAAILAWISVWYAEMPADREHRYGHGKIAYLSLAFEGLLLFFAGTGAFLSASVAWWQGARLSLPLTGIAMMTAVLLINGALGSYLVHFGNERRNPILSTHGQHLLADMWTTLGVVIGLTGVAITDWFWIDSLVGAIVSSYIVFTGAKVCLQAWRGFMEKMDEKLHRQIESVLVEAVEQGLLQGYHQLRHRRVHHQIWIELHMLFDGALSLEEAHRRASLIEILLLDSLAGENAIVTSHLEPFQHQRAHPDRHPDAKPCDPSDLL